MKKQWLSIVLVLCMVLCLAPATALAAEGETCELKITVEVNGLIGSAEGAEFTFQIKKAINEVTAQYYEYGTTTVTVGADGKGTSTVSVAPGKYIVKQDVPGKPIGEYVWYSISYTGGNNESGPQSVYGNGNSIEFKVYNTYKPANGTTVTALPITVTGYKVGANVADATVTTTEPKVGTPSFKIKQYNDAAGSWVDLTSGTFQADTKYAIEIFLGKVTGCDYTGLTEDKVTVNGEKASVFENPSTGDMRVFHELEVLKVVKKVVSIEIKTPPIKTEYMAGEDFDPKGMVVTAVYDDNSKADLSRDQYVIFYGDKLTKGQTDVTIQYNDGSGSSNIKTYQKITVKPYVGTHTHTYVGSPWYADAKSHWHQCTDSTCPDPRASMKDLASHTFVWEVDKEATKTQTGSKHEECTVCSHKRSENTVIPVLSDSGTTTPGTTIPGTTGGTTGAAKSPKTGDAGIALYAGLSLLMLSGGGWVAGKKRREEKK